jgi:hypothetical protein
MNGPADLVAVVGLVGAVDAGAKAKIQDRYGLG